MRNTEFQIPTVRPKNRPINILIDWFLDKESGHVGDARKEIKRRFAYLDWEQQERITQVCLRSGRTDRRWIYIHLMKVWDDCFLHLVQDNWEKYHEKHCGWVVIRHFPKKYIMEHIDEFKGKMDYYYICLRFASDEDFVIDDRRLFGLDCLSFHVTSKKPMKTDICLDIVFRCINITCIINSIGYVGYKPRNEVLRIFDFNYIGRMGQYLEAMDMDDAIDALCEWEKAVCKDVVVSTEWKLLNSKELDNKSYDDERIRITKMCMYKNLDAKYKVFPPFHLRSNRQLTPMSYYPHWFCYIYEHSTPWCTSQIEKPKAPTILATRGQAEKIVSKHQVLNTLASKLGLTIDNSYGGECAESASTSLSASDITCIPF